MCGGCNVLAEGAGASLIFARYWWVAREGRKAVAEAERLVEREPVGVDVVATTPGRTTEFVDPLPELTRIT